MPDELRPFGDDTAAAEVISILELDSEDWEYTEAGDYQSACIQAFANDGSNCQTLVALTWPVRNRTTGKTSTLRLLISPADAIGMAEILTHSVRWLKARNIISN